MENSAGQQWFLRKHDGGSIFGPLSFPLLARWAAAAQIAPQDMLSHDAQNWMKSPMVKELGMDWLVEITSERYYGPTTLGAVQEFVRLGEIGQDTFLINTCDGSRRQIAQMQSVFEQENAKSFEAELAGDAGNAPQRSGMAINLNDRVRELEQTLREERRASAAIEVRYRDLEMKYLQLTSLRPEA